MKILIIQYICLISCQALFYAF
ncbi:hypothetical protein [Agarilytica rhodophyticola]